MPQLTVVAADDHPLFLEGLACAVGSRPELELVGRARDGREALALIAELEPDVAVVDVRMPFVDGIAVARVTSRDHPEARVVIVSGYSDPELVYQALEAGASGYITKCAPPEELTDAIVRVGSGEVVLDRGLGKSLADEIRRRGRADVPALTPRERQILGLVSEGLSAGEVAKRLFLGLTTVKTHLTRLYDKLDAPDRASAVAKALRLGLIE